VVITVAATFEKVKSSKSAVESLRPSPESQIAKRSAISAPPVTGTVVFSQPVEACVSKPVAVSPDMPSEQAKVVELWTPAAQDLTSPALPTVMALPKASSTALPSGEPEAWG
jgi:hypothetical protein